MRNIIFSLLLSFLIALLLGELVIPIIKSLKLGQNIREEGPKSHNKKAGTPTFGGIIFISAAIITMLLFQHNKESKLVVYALLAFGAIGFIDDALKKLRKKNEGLTSKQKMVLLLLTASIFAYYVYKNPSIGPAIINPFTGKLFNLGVLYIPFIVFFYVATTNSVNLTDGLDGLATSVTLLVMTFFTLLSFGLGHYTLSVFCGCLTGSLLGFLRYNSFPAKIIMGDTGALALGGVIATVAIILKNPLIVVVVGGIYVMETLSDLIQIAFFKATGKRVFKMAPIHHAFELSGWHEAKIVTVFSIITTILCLLAFLIL
jgi:phospho-N-acetylmuramoyl-pentapeptide-transferase